MPDLAAMHILNACSPETLYMVAIYTACKRHGPESLTELISNFQKVSRPVATYIDFVVEVDAWGRVGGGGGGGGGMGSSIVTGCIQVERYGTRGAGAGRGGGGCSRWL